MVIDQWIDGVMPFTALVDGMLGFGLGWVALRHWGWAVLPALACLALTFVIVAQTQGSFWVPLFLWYFTPFVMCLLLGTLILRISSIHSRSLRAGLALVAIPVFVQYLHFLVLFTFIMVTGAPV